MAAAQEHRHRTAVILKIVFDQSLRRRPAYGPLRFRPRSGRHTSATISPRSGRGGQGDCVFSSRRAISCSWPFNLACGALPPVVTRGKPASSASNVNPARPVRVCYGQRPTWRLIGGQAEYFMLPTRISPAEVFPERDQAPGEDPRLDDALDIFPAGYHGATPPCDTGSHRPMFAGRGGRSGSAAVSRPRNCSARLVVIVGDMITRTLG